MKDRGRFAPLRLLAMGLVLGVVLYVAYLGLGGMP